MSISPIAAISSGGADLSRLAELYQRQVAGLGTDPTTGAAANSALGSADATGAIRGADFAAMIGEGLQKVEGLDLTASTKAVQAATGDLTDVHDYVIAAQEAQVATELTTTLRNKALESFNEIMRMPL
ncbi:MAG TPA: flagellar hook-basal body complex protein FliE [Kineosporiaceae bacterium]|nr:flagellar hook-basal body complex protein FliE [Kineosporiaceae bacterium]